MSDTTDRAAEALVLTAAVAQSGLISTMVALDPAVFTTPIHQIVHSTLVDLFRAGEPRDPVSIARRATQAAASRHQGEEVTRFISAAIGRGEDLSVGFHIDRLQSLQRARRVAGIGSRLTQMAEEYERLDDPSILDRAVENARAELETADAISDTSVDHLPMSLTELLDKKYDHDWLIPDLLERTDRLILTGFEGTGKSYLVAQMAMTIAAGLHPFLGVPMTEPNQVLVIDAENSERQTGRRYRMMRTRIETLCAKHGHDIPDWSSILRFVIRAEGIALNDPRQVQRIERAIAVTQPKFVALGPLYRLHKLDTRDEQAAKELTDVIDHLRVKYRFSVVCEAHVAHGQAGAQRLLRPTGSSLFLRWPEFGMGLRPSMGTENQQHPDRVDLATWRGGREDRMWPRHLQHGTQDHHLPWNNGDADYYAQARERGYI